MRLPLPLSGLSGVRHNGVAFPAKAGIHTRPKSWKVGPGVLIRRGAGGIAGEIIGSVGISGDTSDKDEACAVYGISCAGLTPDPG
jgi:uncharacterized protein GlcG (DUF336 family)